MPHARSLPLFGRSVIRESYRKFTLSRFLATALFKLTLRTPVSADIAPLRFRSVHFRKQVIVRGVRQSARIVTACSFVKK